jgi:hypothetical protein
MLLLTTWLLAAPPDLAAIKAFSAELWRVAEDGGATCEWVERDGVAVGHTCRWPDGTLLASADYSGGYRHFLYFPDGEVQTECVLAEGRFDCAEWDESGRRLSLFEAAARQRSRTAEVTLVELDRTNEARQAFSALVGEVWQAHAASPQRIRAATLLARAHHRRLARATQLAAMGFVELEIDAILREEERGGRPVDALPLVERVRPTHACAD